MNSLQFLKIKKEKIENSYIISKRRKEVENDLKEDNIITLIKPALLENKNNYHKFYIYLFSLIHLHI